MSNSEHIKDEDIEWVVLKLGEVFVRVPKAEYDRQVFLNSYYDKGDEHAYGLNTQSVVVPDTRFSQIKLKETND